jgi:hypothetical protein
MAGTSLPAAASNRVYGNDAAVKAARPDPQNVRRFMLAPIRTSKTG